MQDRGPTPCLNRKGKKRCRRLHPSEARVTAKAEEEEGKKPSLLISKEEGCEPPKKIEYKPDQQVEELCSSLPQTVQSGANKSDGMRLQRWRSAGVPAEGMK